MSSLTLTLNVMPVSINRYHYATKRFKTAEAREYEQEVLRQLAPHRKELKEMGNRFEKDNGTFAVAMDFNYPDFYNKQGRVSAKNPDITNCEKSLLDLIFQRTMGVDDRFVVSLLSTKCAAPENGSPFITVTISLLELEPYAKAE